MYVNQLMAVIRPNETCATIDTYTDNEAAVSIVKANGVTARTKHFERWVSYARDLYQRGIIRIKHIGTDNMHADIFTKPLDKTTFLRHRAQLMFEPDPN